MRFSLGKVEYLWLALLVCALPMASLIMIKWYEGQQPPSYDEMYSFAVSQLTDSQIRELHIEAEEQFARDQRDAANDAKNFWLNHDAECAKAADPAYKARHPDACALPLDWQNIGKLPEYDSVEEIFQGKIMGLCDVVSTVAEARRVKCLPPQ